MDSQLHTFLIINIAIVLSCSVYVLAAPKVMAKWHTSRSLVVLGHFLLVMCLAAPFVVKLLPGKVFTVTISSLQPPAEFGPRLFPNSSDVRSAGRRKTQKYGTGHSLWQESFFKNISSLDLLFGIILISSFVALARLLSSGIRLHHFLKRSYPHRHVGRVRIVISDEIVVPFSFWNYRGAWVVIPSNLIGQPNHLKIAVQHEIQHHRQRDTVWAVVWEIVGCLFFLNPFYRKLKNKVREYQEYACDEFLVGQRRVHPREYASCLIQVAEAALCSRQMFVGTTNMAAASGDSRHSKSLLRRRVEMFQVYERPRKSTQVGFAIGTAVLLTTLSLAYAGEQSRRQTEQMKVNPGTVPVDESVQQITNRILERAVQDQRASGGFAIVIAPATGKVLAVSEFQKSGPDPEPVASTETLRKLVEPASITKAFALAIGLEKNLLETDTMLNCENGKYQFGGRLYRDHRDFDTLTAAETISKSSNICGIKIGEKVGYGNLASGFKDFGFGVGGSTKDFPGARAGQLPLDGPANSDNVVAISTGYSGTFVNPLELAIAFAAMTNGGKLMKPLKANESDGQAKVIRQVLRPEVAEKMKRVLAEVTISGTASGRATSHFYSTGGKTASAYGVELEADHDRLGGNRSMGSFVGFAPVENPKVLIYVGIMDPVTLNPAGSVTAAPVFKNLMESILVSWKVAPDKL